MSAEEAAKTSHYETDSLLADYLLFHFGSDEEILPSSVVWPPGMKEALQFPVRTVSHFEDKPVERGLDLGCAVGRSSWEMTKSCKSVIGIDFSPSFIRAAKQLQSHGTLPYLRQEEAHLSSRLEAKAPEPIGSERLSFEQGDAMDLRGDLGSFDRVHGANLICRLTEPLRLLQRLPALVNPGGELVLATPCTWLETYTPSENWPDTDTLSWLAKRLDGDFTLVRTTDEPFLIRETARKFQWTRSLVSIWKRNQ